MFCKKGVLQNYAKLAGKHLCQNLFLTKLQGSGLRPGTVFKKKLRHRCFPKFLRTPLFIEYLQWLLLENNHLKMKLTWRFELVTVINGRCADSK